MNRSEKLVVSLCLLQGAWSWGARGEAKGEGLLTVFPMSSPLPMTIQGKLGPRLESAYCSRKEHSVGFFLLFSGKRSFSSGSLSHCLGVYDFSASVDKQVLGNLIKPQIQLVYWLQDR